MSKEKRYAKIKARRKKHMNAVEERRTKRINKLKTKRTNHSAKVEARKEKHAALVTARRAKLVLQHEKRDKASLRRESKNSKDLNNKYKGKDTSQTREISLYSKSNAAKIEIKRAKILKDNGSEAAKKFDKKIQSKDQKARIKHINKLNKTQKGVREIPNSSRDVLIDVKGLRKAYTGKSIIFDALKNVDLTIKKGEFVVILGPSGSGKSTLLNMISGLDRPTSGEIIVDGVNICALKENELTRFRRDNIGFVFQSYNLMSTLSVKDNIEVGRSLQKDRNLRKDSSKLLADMSMSDQGNKRTYELSGGQQQRVSIARALSKRPSILIGDEPTGALDTKSGIEVLNIFKDINKNEKTTIIIVTHDKDIAQLADKVIYVKDSIIDKVVLNKNPKPASYLLSVK
ncbi:MAG: ABC transporter ATP-binding protein [Mycoplasmataceae bacterium]|nr:ABC transporter ATP-binding protein [Mycoplasmataceae bacterium]